MILDSKQCWVVSTQIWVIQFPTPLFKVDQVICFQCVFKKKPWRSLAFKLVDPSTFYHSCF